MDRLWVAWSATVSVRLPIGEPRDPPANVSQPGGLSTPIAPSASHIGCPQFRRSNPGYTNAAIDRDGLPSPRQRARRSAAARPSSSPLRARRRGPLAEIRSVASTSAESTRRPQLGGVAPCLPLPREGKSWRCWPDFSRRPLPRLPLPASQRSLLSSCRLAARRRNGDDALARVPWKRLGGAITLVRG
jgi:hypothetical protein